MFSSSTLIVFGLAALGLLVIPGPAVLYIVTRSVAHGRRAGLASVLGIELGSLVHSGAAAVGLSAILMASAAAFDIVKYVGAAYLIYLGVRTLLSRGSQPSAAKTPPRTFAQLFWKGFLVQLLNPKTALFFYAFLPQFVDKSRGGVPEQVVFLGLLFVLLATCTDGLYAIIGSGVGRLVMERPGFQRLQRFITGGILIGLGVAAAVSGDRRN